MKLGAASTVTATVRCHAAVVVVVGDVSCGLARAGVGVEELKALIEAGNSRGGVPSRRRSRGGGPAVETARVADEPGRESVPPAAMVAPGPASTEGAALLTTTWELSLSLVCPSSPLTVTA